MRDIYLGLGSNLGDKSANISLAIKKIGLLAGPVLLRSGLYRTKAWGKTDQSDFLNQVIEIECDLPPMELLDTVLSIERAMGRVRRRKWRERIIDIDLLLYGREILDHPRLQVPHPFMQDRNFVLYPLREIAPGFVHPVLNQTIDALCLNSPDELAVERLET